MRLHTSRQGMTGPPISKRAWEAKVFIALILVLIGVLFIVSIWVGQSTYESLSYRSEYHATLLFANNTTSYQADLFFGADGPFAVQHNVSLDNVTLGGFPFNGETRADLVIYGIPSTPLSWELRWEFNLTVRLSVASMRLYATASNVGNSKPTESGIKSLSGQMALWSGSKERDSVGLTRLAGAAIVVGPPEGFTQYQSLRQTGAIAAGALVFVTVPAALKTMNDLVSPTVRHYRGEIKEIRLREK